MTTITPIDIGTSPNDGTGDPLRTAFSKINANEAALNATKTEGIVVATVQGGMVGDGVTDNLAAWNALIAANDAIFIPAGTYFFSGPMVIPVDANGNTEGKVVYGDSSRLTIIKGTSGQPSVISVGNGSTPFVSTNVQIKGIGIGHDGGAGVAIGLHLDKTSVVTLDDIAIFGGPIGGTFGTGFKLDTFSSKLTNLISLGANITEYGFHCIGDFNANWCAGWETNSFSEANVLIDAALGHGNVFNALTVQGGDIGLYCKRGFGNSVNGLYCENTVIAVKLGDFSESATCLGLHLSGLDLGGPFPGHPNVADAIACLELSNCHGISISGVYFTGADFAGNSCTVTISGDGTGATAKSRCNKDGTLHSIVVIKQGSGYTSATASITGGTGSGATANVTVSGGLVTDVTLTNPGSGYTPVQCPAAIRYTYSKRVVINGEYINDGDGLNSSLWAWIVRGTGATGTSDIILPSTLSQSLSATGYSSEIRKLGNSANEFAIIYYDTAGDPVVRLFTAPEMT